MSSLVLLAASNGNKMRSSPSWSSFFGCSCHNHKNLSSRLSYCTSIRFSRRLIIAVPSSPSSSQKEFVAACAGVCNSWAFLIRNLVRQKLRRRTSVLACVSPRANNRPKKDGQVEEGEQQEQTEKKSRKPRSTPRPSASSLSWLAEEFLYYRTLAPPLAQESKEAIKKKGEWSVSC
jgi:hypothetical protein